MAQYQFMSLTRIRMGEGTLDGIGDEVVKLGSKVLIVTDPGIVKAGLAKLVESRLSAAGLTVTTFSDVEGNPTVLNVEAGLAVQKKSGATVIVAIGGGSAIDAAKAVAVLATNGGKLRDYHGFERFSKRPLPLLAVPTTVGTGSETTKGSVITDPVAHDKIIVVSDMMYPITAYLDPQMVATLPATICAWTGIDALTHAIEGYVAKGANAFSDALNLQAIRLIAKCLRPACKGDKDALHQMQCAAALAGAGFHNAGLGLAHALANTVGGRFGTHHGATNGVLLPHVMQFNLPAAVSRFATIGAELGGKPSNQTADLKAAEQAVVEVKRLMLDIHAPLTLSELGVQSDSFPTLANQALGQLDRPANPRDNDESDLLGILRAAA